jgi:hypothetical protein
VTPGTAQPSSVVEPNMEVRPADAGGFHMHDELHRLAVVMDLHSGQHPVPGSIGGPPAQSLMAGLPQDQRLKYRRLGVLTGDVGCAIPRAISGERLTG